MQSMFHFLVGKRMETIMGNKWIEGGRIIKKFTKRLTFLGEEFVAHRTKELFIISL